MKFTEILKTIILETAKFTALYDKYVKPGKELSDEIKDFLKQWFYENKQPPKVILLKNHGLITLGSTVEECIINTEICEKSAEIFIGSMLFGKIDLLNEEEINELVNDKDEKYRLSKV